MKLEDLGEYEIVSEPTQDAGFSIDRRNIPLSSLDESQTALAQSQSLLDEYHSSLPGKIIDTAGQFSEGVAKGELSTAKGAATLGQGFLNQTGGRIANFLSGKGFKPTKGGIFPVKDQEQQGDFLSPGTPAEQKASEFLTPQGLPQQIGYGTEKAAEFLVPGSAASKGEHIIELLSAKIPNTTAGILSRVTGKGLLQGLSAGATRLIQTGGDLKEAKNAALVAGLTRSGMATIGEGARAIRLPERLYSTIFKNTASDMMSELKTENLVNLKTSNPQKYAQFVEQGIIQESAGGPVVNETIAQQALDRGLKGSIRKMARTVINGALESESKVRSLTKNYAGTVDMTEPQFKNILQKIGQEYEDVGFGEISNEANKLAGILESSGGNVSAETALNVRRLLDRARIASSFEKPASSLSMTQSNLKTLADTARKRVNAVPGIGEVMKEYAFNIEAMETLAKEAARRGNNQALSLIDSLFLSSAFGGNNMIPGVTAGMARKFLMSGPGITRLAQTINNPNIGVKASTALQAGASGLQSQLSPQE